MFYLLGQILDWVQDLDWQGWLSAKQERKKKPIKTLLKNFKKKDKMSQLKQKMKVISNAMYVYMFLN